MIKILVYILLISGSIRARSNRLRAVLFLGLLLPVTSLADTQKNCQVAVVSEYCFGSATFADLLPVEALEVEMLKHSTGLLLEREPQSTLSQRQQTRISKEWLEAVKEAGAFARSHFVTLDVLFDETPIDFDGVTLNGAILGAFDQGPILRLTFEEDADGTYRLNAPVEVHVERLRRAVRLVRGAFGLTFRFLIDHSFGSAIRKLETTDFGEEYVEISDLIDRVGLTKGYARLMDASRRADQDWRTILGAEMFFVLHVSFDEKIRERNLALTPSVHFFNDRELEDQPVKSPQVTFFGQLLLPDSAVESLDPDDLRLLLKHEAMHLARPNFFMTLGAANEVIRLRFPQIDMTKTNTLITDFLGFTNDNQTPSCALDVAKDDEMFIDYYVFQLIRNNPDEVSAYYDLLTRLQDENDGAAVSQLAFRTKLASQYIDTLGTDYPTYGIAYQDKYFWSSIWKAAQNNFQNYLGGQLPNIDDIMIEMAKIPAIERDTAMLRTIIQYYQSQAKAIGDHSVGMTGMGDITCSRLARMLRMRM